MKAKFYIIILFACFTRIGISCKTASKLYDKGNYDEAVERAAHKLQKDPADLKLLDILQNAYTYAVNDHENRISNYAAGNNELKWEAIYNEYALLQKMYDVINKAPSVLSIVNPTDYSSYVVTYREKAGDVRFDRGLNFMNQYNKQSYRNAYWEFQTALQFKPGNRNIMLKKNEAYEYAVTNVIVLPLHQQAGYFHSSSSAGSNNPVEQIIRNLQYSSGNEFVKFYSAWDPASRGIRVDEEIDMQLAKINIGRYYDYHSTKRVSREVVIKETVYKPDSIVKEYAKVYADITTTRRTINSTALLEAVVKEYNGRWLWNDHYNAAHVWTTEFATYTGDARALSVAEKQLIERRKEFAPTENEIIRVLIAELSDKALYGLKNFYYRN